MSTTHYVAGFFFNGCRNQVALIRKKRPAWQNGKLNGIGGHVEPNEDALGAMVREFEEETGVFVWRSDWKHFCQMVGTNNDGEGFKVDFYWTVGDVGHLRQRTDEPIELVDVDRIHALRNDTIGNIPWLVALARDCAAGVHPPQTVVATYTAPSSTK